MTETGLHPYAPRSAVLKLSYIFALCCGLAALGGCATTQTFSYLDGKRWSHVELDTYDTLIVSVDDKYHTYNSFIRVDPGRHTIKFRTVPVSGFRESPERTLVLDVEPCMQYWFEAKRSQALSQDFEPRVNYKAPIAGCGSPSGS